MYYLSSDLGWYTSMILLIPAIIFSAYAQFKVTSNYNKFARIANRRNMSGAEAARRVLDANNLRHVGINVVGGRLSDYYDPRTQTVNLSQEVYSGATIAAISIASHECGHAIQHAQSYAALKLRNSIVPITNFASGLAIPLFLLGLFLSIPGLETLGILLFSFAVFFQAITLPVEFNASRRALAQMKDLGIVYDDESRGAKKVLGAAAMTYVAALLVSLMQLVRLILISRSRR